MYTIHEDYFMPADYKILTLTTNSNTSFNMAILFVSGFETFSG
jgi:hypothetical protein